MQNQHSQKNILLGIFFCFILALTSVAFQDSANFNNSVPTQVGKDTIPKNHDIDIQIDLKGLDETIKKSLEIAEKSIKQIDWDKISKQVELSIKQIDMEKLQMEINKSIKSIDWTKMENEIERSMKEIDMKKMQAEIDKAMIDVKKEINSKEFKKEMEKLKRDLEIKKKALRQAQDEMEKNKEELKKLNREYVTI